MATGLIGDWQIAHVGESERFFLYSKAYLGSAAALCREMTKHEGARTWPNASVVLLLAAHSLELFLKAAIYAREPGAEIGHHRIADLFSRFRELFPEKVFEFDPPFRTEYVGFSEEEIEALKRKEPVPSIVYRYPVSRPGEEWNGIRAFEPEGFLDTLDALAYDYERIQDAI